MIGTWTGYYRYESIKYQKVQGFERTTFSIIIKSFDGKNFQGVVNDDIKSGGMEGTGEIIGEISGKKLFFKKLMPNLMVKYPNGEKEISAKKHPTLYYSGAFSKDNTHLEGTWKFHIRLVFLFGLIPIPHRGGKGTWAMTLQ